MDSIPLHSAQKLRTFNEARLQALQARHQSLCEQPPPLPVKKKHSKCVPPVCVCNQLLLSYGVPHTLTRPYGFSSIVLLFSFSNNFDK